MRSDTAKVTAIGTVLAMSALGLTMWGLPTYSVWQQGLSGQAELARASQNRQIAIQEAQAKFEAADFLNKAEIRRAEGVAEANAIIGESLKGNAEYLRYLWIQGVTDAGTNPTVIYVPTEGGLPILEAGKRE